MTNEEIHEDNPIITAAGILGRRLRLSRCVSALDFGLFYASLATLVVAILGQLHILPFGFAVAGGIIGLSVLGSVAAGMLRPVSDERVLLDADRAMDFKERLYTGYRVLTGKEHTAYRDILLEDAGRRAKDLNAAEVYKIDTAKKFRFTPFLLLIAVVLLVVDFSSIGRKDPLVVNEGLYIEEFGKRLAARAERESLPGSKELAEELQRLGQRLQNEKITQDQGQQLVKKLSERVEEQIENIQRDLTAGVEQSEFELDEETQESLQEMRRSEMSSAEIVELKRRILSKKGLSPRQRQDVQESFDQYERNPNEEAQSDLADELSRELGDYDGYENGSGNDPAMEEELDNYETANNMMRRSSENLAKGNRGPGMGSGSPDDQGAESQSGGGMAPGEMAGGGLGSPGDDGLDGEGTTDEGQQSGNTPGKTPEKDRFDGSFAASQEWKPVDELKGLINPERNMRAFVRTMPKTDEQREEITTEDLLLTYRSRYEEVIQKEDIPPNMKEYIRDYFINIGIGQEE